MFTEAAQATEPAPATPAEGGAQAELDISGGIDLVRVPHPDFASEPEQAETAQPEAGQDASAQEPEGQGGAQAEPAQENQEGQQDQDGQAEPGQDAAPYMTLKHRGREIPVKNQDQVKALAQMGLDYSAKTHAIAPIVQRFPSLIQAMSNPELASRLDAILGGKAPDSGQALDNAEPQGAEQPGQAQPMTITDPNTGEPVPVDPGFLAVLDQWAKAKGIGTPRADETLIRRLEALEATAPAPREVADRQVETVHQHVKATLGFDDFKEAVPKIIENMAARGIGRGDPRDNPETWLSIYKDLRLTGQFTGKRETTPKPKTDMHQTKVQAAGASPAPGTKQGGIDWKAATKKAMDSGRTDDMVDAVAVRISHPDFD